MLRQRCANLQHDAWAYGKSLAVSQVADAWLLGKGTLLGVPLALHPSCSQILHQTWYMHPDVTVRLVVADRCPIYHQLTMCPFGSRQQSGQAARHRGSLLSQPTSACQILILESDPDQLWAGGEAAARTAKGQAAGGAGEENPLGGGFRPMGTSGASTEAPQDVHVKL